MRDIVTFQLAGTGLFPATAAKQTIRIVEDMFTLKFGHNSAFNNV
jgi:hypothetical protein